MRTALCCALLAVWLFGCSASNAPEAQHIHGDQVLDQVYGQWLANGTSAPAPDGKEHALRGRASWYGPGFHGRMTANGESYDMYGMSAAHRTLPFGTIVRATRPDTQQLVVVRINDRGPYVDGRILDLSYGAAHDLGMLEAGVVDVQLDVIAWGDGRRVHN